MHLSSLLGFLLLLQSSPEQQALDRIRQAVDSRSVATVRGLFAHKEDADALADLAGRGGMAGIGVKVIPAPPGWTQTGNFWAIFHKFQAIEAQHDLVYALARTPEGYVIGKEVPETMTGGFKIKHAWISVVLNPSAKAVQVASSLDLDSKPDAKSAVFRLNDIYEVIYALRRDGVTPNLLIADDKTVPKPKEGDILRAGGLLIAWNSGPIKNLIVRYSGVVNTPGEDKISDKVCYLTAWWVPSIGRLPHTTATRIIGPKDWVLVSEGVPTTEAEVSFPFPASYLGNMQVKFFKCDVPISYPKVIGGKYTLAAEATVGKNTFRSFQLDPVDKARGERDVQVMKDAAAFYEKNLGPLPFPGYACYDADTYYGIESYSYTLLNRTVTTRFVSHEMGHTYFGGLVPCSYTRDTWNEGMTQYVDSVLFQKDRDRTLEAGLRTINVPLPLTKFSQPWMFGSASYYRGAYVMRMLENEIGLDKVLAGLSALIADRRGVDTSWPELRPYFEKASGQKLDWFWDQWIENAAFPTLEIMRADLREFDGKWVVFVTVRHSGTPAPYRLRYRIKVAGPEERAVTTEFTASKKEESFRIQTEFPTVSKPHSVSLDVFGLSLAKTPLNWNLGSD